MQACAREIRLNSGIFLFITIQGKSKFELKDIRVDLGWKNEAKNQDEAQVLPNLNRVGPFHRRYWGLFFISGFFGVEGATWASDHTL